MPRISALQPRTLTGRLLLWHAVAVLAILLMLGVVADRVLEHYLVGQLTDELISDARAAALTLPTSGDLEPEVRRLGLAVGARITLIRTDGVVLADSEADPATMENHRTRPEVIQALRGHIGESSRTSATVGIPFRYVALPPQEGRIVRVALPLTTVNSRLGTVRLILAIGFGLAAMVGLAVLYWIARSLSRPLRSIASSMETLGRGGPVEHLPESGTEEVRILARTVNTMRADVASRIEALEEEGRTRDAILSSLDEGVVLFDGEGALVYANDRALALLGPGVRSVRNLASPEVRTAVGAAAGEGRASTTEIVMGSTARTIRAIASPVPGDGHVLLVLRDVTQARTLDAVRRDFVANASHELKTPVASIRALAETISSASEGDPAAVPRFSVQLERESLRLARIISDLLDLSRLEGEMGERDRVRLDELVTQEADRYRERAAEAGLTLTVEAGQPVTVDGSERDLGLLVRNLVENAVQYTREGGRVEVSVARSDSQAVLQVRDSGIGIPAKDRDRIFERFYRVDRARSRATGGTGLGLSIVRHVAENHGGEVRVQSELGRGSTFTVRLPVSRGRAR